MNKIIINNMIFKIQTFSKMNKKIYNNINNKINKMINKNKINKN